MKLYKFDINNGEYIGIVSADDAETANIKVRIAYHSDISFKTNMNCKINPLPMKNLSLCVAEYHHTEK